VGTSNPIPGSRSLELGLLIVLIGAISLLGLGALPQSAFPRTGAAAFVIRRRGAIAAAGGIALLTFALLYFL
jgi:hypothetical protein